MSEAPARTGDRLALVIGSGLALEAADHLVPGTAATPRQVPTAWGPVELLEVGPVLVLARHGLTRFTPAHRVDHRRNVAALAAAGTGRVAALASTGSLRADWPPGTLVCPDDLLAFSATATYFDDVRGHHTVGFDPEWRRTVLATWSTEGGAAPEDGGVYAQTTGPRFETPAEVRFLAHHADLVGMTLADECTLAGEAGLAHAAVCSVDNLANGIGDGGLSVEDVQAGAARAAERLTAGLRSLVSALA